ncbi:MAG: hypothetical protein DRR19_15305 [Candidatus Parabeggiatoa sp. nov. 1]|nr:MAG: hypothetical protein DRR19_15305 [Gammaproteobacteria bacterium]
MGLKVNLTQWDFLQKLTGVSCTKRLCRIAYQWLGLLNLDSSCNPSGLSTESELPINRFE